VRKYLLDKDYLSLIVSRAIIFSRNCFEILDEDLYIFIYMQIILFYLIGGVALVYVGQPLDTVKVKMQTFPSMYKGMVNCFLRTLRTDGIVRGLYAGTIPAVVANVAENSVLFAAYGGCQKAIVHLSGKS